MNTCMGCEKRYIGCHGKCDDYKVFIDKQKAVHKNRAEYKRKLDAEFRPVTASRKRK